MKKKSNFDILDISTKAEYLEYFLYNPKQDDFLQGNQKCYVIQNYFNCICLKFNIAHIKQIIHFCKYNVGINKD